MLRETLEKAGIRMTQQRIEVFLEVLHHSEEHPSVHQVFDGIRERMPTISLDTVYRTLWILSEVGLISPVTSSTDGVRFEWSGHPHHHFVCARCGRTIDFESGSMDKVRVPEEAAGLGEVWNAHLEVRGLCNRCREQGRSSERGEAEHG